ncbi:SurA N-terminal domain-containing protein [Alkalihalophilus marmarensis]|jgi:hypothetical protein|uniref:SurA N-terminal domain-containing protein n=1 Tax=Alkalihalophilus marmarensis TaxID=521377 RepID=UPI00203CF9D9|nr:SurA N-terminal domain-containing protein [Alkalihalophilus marmarensis]MCM3489849.1 SurA N-terminal domain-containing protein [Alkalihalophilus marmarensis]
MKAIILGLLLSVIIVTGCSNVAYDLDEVVAVLEGEEIKAKDVLTLYPVDDEGIRNFVLGEVLVQESKNMGIFISEEEIESNKTSLYPGLEAQEIYETLPEEGKAFYEEQAEVLNVTPEEYYEIWLDAHHTHSAYIQAYTNKVIFNTDLEEDIDLMDPEDLEIMDQRIDDHMNELMQLYKGNGKLTVM